MESKIHRYYGPFGLHGYTLQPIWLGGPTLLAFWFNFEGQIGMNLSFRDNMLCMVDINSILLEFHA